MLIRLRELRKEYAISQQKLADEMHISQQSINKYENHDTEPDIRLLKQMAEYFHTTVDYLIGYSDDPVKPLAPNTALSREEAALVKNYRELSENEKKSIQCVIENYRNIHTDGT